MTERMEQPGLKIGDEVTFRVAHLTFRARVVEDRGPIGINGRQIVRVELLEDDESSDADQFELPAEELERLATA